jgi:hypothetical protein
MSPWDKVWIEQPKLEKLVLLPAFRNQVLFGKITNELARNVVRTEVWSYDWGRSEENV